MKILAKNKIHLIFVSAIVGALPFGFFFLMTNKPSYFAIGALASILIAAVLMHTVTCPNCGKKVTGFPNLWRILFRWSNPFYTNFKGLKCAYCGFLLKEEKKDRKK